MELHEYADSTDMRSMAHTSEIRENVHSVNWIIKISSFF